MTPARLVLLCLSIAAAAFAQAPQRSIEIWSEHPIALEVEWLTIDEAGKQTVTARRKTAVGPPVPLEFTPGSDRYVRFSYQGASPRTYSITELIAAKKLRVPDVLPGGELLLLVPRMTVRPVELQIEGPRVKTVAIERALHASLPGLPAGDYRVIPVYEGGIRGDARTFAVSVAQTTVVHQPAEDVGGVRVLAAEEVCTEALEMGISASADLPGARRIVTTRQPRCDMTFGGLKPGKFEVFFRGESSGGAGSMFEVAPQAVSVVEVAGRRVRVEGRVTLNGKAVTTGVVTFSPRGERRATETSARIDDAGFYRASLDEPGTYAVTLRGLGTFMGGSKPATFVEGRNLHDVAITGGTIKVEIAGWQPRTRVEIRIEGKTGSMSTTYAIRPPAPLIFQALPFGEYKVSVASGERRLRQTPENIKTVVLSAGSPEATLRFTASR